MRYQHIALPLSYLGISGLGRRNQTFDTWSQTTYVITTPHRVGRDIGIQTQPNGVKVRCAIDYTISQLKLYRLRLSGVCVDASLAHTDF